MIMVIAVYPLPDRLRQDRPRTCEVLQLLEIGGILLLVPGIVCWLLRLELGEGVGWRSPEVLILLIRGLISCLCFLVL